MLARLASALLALLAVTGTAWAQMASLVADSISIEADSRLVAEGNVEVIYEETQLRAPRIVYDRENDTLLIDGPLVLIDGDDTVVLADSAELDQTLSLGIIRSARVVLDRQLQIAAAEITRVSGRYSRLSRVTASQCQICGTQQPLWEIRAARVIRDETERQLYFEDATVRLAGFPVFYVPRLRLPDPTLERATGFLVPTIRSRSLLSTGVVVPYFIKIGDYRDLTLAPFVTSKTRTLEFTFRDAYARGRTTFEGAISKDDLRPDGLRGYLFGRGAFALPEDFVLRFDIELASDDSYLFDYGYSEKSRLDSALRIERTRDDQRFVAQGTAFETLRELALPIDRELPNSVLVFDLRQRLFQDAVFGSVWGEVNFAALNRPSDQPVIGRDVDRLRFDLDWNTNTLLANGMVIDAEAELGLDIYNVDEDPRFEDNPVRARQGVAVTLRWPFARQERSGARNMVEPLVQLGWAEATGNSVPNEDSRSVEFDEGNLLSLSRFPGTDRYEQGLRLNVGLAWTRQHASGWSIGATVGRIYRYDERDQFGPGTGLAGNDSDWLVAAHYRLRDSLVVTSRSLLGDELDLSQSETRVTWFGNNVTLSGTHIWRAFEPAEDRFDDLSEVSLFGAFRLSDYWSADAEWRYNGSEGTTTSADLGLRYENECISIGLSLSRNFTTSTNVSPVTEIDFTVSLAGLGSGGNPNAARRKCRG